MNSTKINIVLFGLDDLGSSLVKSLISQQKNWLQEQNIDVCIPVIANSEIVFFENKSKKNNWDADFKNFGSPINFEQLTNYLIKNPLENPILIDTTTSQEIPYYYPDLLHNNIEIISTNPVAQNLPAEIAFLFKITQKNITSISQKEDTQKIIEQKILEIAEKPILKIAI